MKSLIRILIGLILLVILPVALMAVFPKLADWANQQSWIQLLYFFLIGAGSMALFSGLDLMNRVNIFKAYKSKPDAEKEAYWKGPFQSDRRGFLRTGIMVLLLMAIALVVLVYSLNGLPKNADSNWYLWTIKALGFAMAIGIVMVLFAVLNINHGKKAILGVSDAGSYAPGQPREKTWVDILFQLRPTFMDSEVDLKEDFDGISELDNPPPPWFMGLFYATILFAGVYMVRYAWMKTAPNPDQEYVADNNKLKADATAWKATHEEQIDEKHVTLITDKDKLAEAGKTFKLKCAVCHGENAQGNSGPNLTDEYWLHGNSVQEVFNTITNGVIEKGMLSWKDQISAAQRRALASYVLSLQGSKPAGGKEPQGDKLEMKEKF